MAFKHGRFAGVYLDSRDLSPYLNEASMSIDAETADVTTFDQADTGWRDHIAGLLGATFSTSGFYDPAEFARLNSVALDGVALTYCPGAREAVGDPARLMAVIGSSYGESSTVAESVGIAYDAQVSGAVAFGYVLHPLAEDTNTTTGSSKDDTAATTTGWTAHLHVTAVDGGSWVVKLEDSANNSDWSDVTGGAFTAVTTSDGQRLTSASATTTLRRYVRYTATRTGGAGGDGITFALAIARSNA